MKLKWNFFFLLCLLPLMCVAEGERKNIHFYAESLAIFNTILLITSLVCIKQFFFPGEKNRTPFQILNAVLIVVFYSISLTFLVHNKDYYEGYATLSNAGCIRKFFFDADTATIKQWVIVAGFLVNILYIARNSKDAFYQR